MKITRHGDIILKPVVDPTKIKSLEESTKKRVRSFIVARGEATGHTHELIPCSGMLAGLCLENEKLLNDSTTEEFLDVIETENSRFINVVGNDYVLRHQEHNELRIDPGYYEITREREEDHIARKTRRVID